jgi:D-beta-D-heptose 7-phosphate kinase/D-beta-D-heptose 1-phosphate adenosyltransferase
MFQDLNVSNDYIINQKNRKTSKKTRILSSQQQVVRFDQESTDDISLSSQKKLINIFKNIFKKYDLIIFSDYGKGVLTKHVSSKLIAFAKNENIKILVDPKGIDYSKYSGAFLITPNKKEAGQATNTVVKDEKSVSKAIKMLKEKYALQISIITLSEQGIAVFDSKLRIHPTKVREVFDVTGAGDTVIAALGFALSCNDNIDDAVKFANLASGVVVGKIGSASTTLNEVIAYESSFSANTSQINIKNWKDISSIVNGLKTQDKKIVFTNGCFDILHIGHVKYLEAAKSLGDVLILGLNSDKSIRSLKGNNRPINFQNERSTILSALKAVDYVVIFDEDTPLNLIKLINPDVIVKGGDYKKKDIVGHDIVNEIKIIPFLDGNSTTNIINRIKKL